MREVSRFREVIAQDCKLCGVLITRTPPGHYQGTAVILVCWHTFAPVAAAFVFIE
jgi:hypothetical protein